ncbi:MAG: GntR family transcriptional regulator [Burkholderiaceae bacterium]|nr:GntR family transcriptional regulator [Burkholderiaceae bacterium]
MRTLEQSASFSPLYQQIKELILGSLQAGEWQPGQAIPSEMNLAERYKVSQGTVRKAIDELASENLVVRHQGKGTFVASHREEAVQYRFLRLVPDNGKELILKSKFLSCETVQANEALAKQFNIKNKDSLILIKRVQSFHGRPVVYELIYLLATRFQGITLERLTSWPGPLYGFYETEFATHMVRAEEHIKALGADHLVAEHLSLNEAAPVLQVERRTFTYGNKTVEVRLAHYETQDLHYANDLN